MSGRGAHFSDSHGGPSLPCGCANANTHTMAEFCTHKKRRKCFKLTPKSTLNTFAIVQKKFLELLWIVLQDIFTHLLISATINHQWNPKMLNCSHKLINLKMNKDLGGHLRQYKCEIRKIWRSSITPFISQDRNTRPKLALSTKRKTKNEVLAVSTNALSTHLNN